MLTSNVWSSSLDSGVGVCLFYLKWILASREHWNVCAASYLFNVFFFTGFRWCCVITTMGLQHIKGCHHIHLLYYDDAYPASCIKHTPHQCVCLWHGSIQDGICALRSTPSVRSFPIVGWYLCAALHPISQKFPHCWMVSVRCAPSHLSEVSPLLDGICALHSTPSLRSFPIVGWYVCAALHPISQKFPHCCLWNSLNVRLIDDGPLLNFQRRLSSTSSFHASHRLSVYIIRLVQKGE